MSTQTESKPKLEQFITIERAVLYGRVSYDDRDTDGRNLKGQIEMGRERAQEKSYRVVAELPEDEKGASGAEIDLPKLNQIREMARAGEFDVLIVRELDRLSRNLAKQLIIEEELKRAGVRVEYVLADYDDTPEGRLQKHIKATVAEYEREKINERMTRGRHLKIKNGNVFVSGKPPYGYRLSEDGTTFVIYEPEARIVRLIFEWYVVEDQTTIQIVRKLTELSIPTPTDAGLYFNPKRRRKPGEWSRSTVHHILSNPTYYGVWQYNKVSEASLIEVSVPPIISLEVFKAAETARVQQRRYKAGNQLKYEYLLARRLKCGCGAAMRGFTCKPKRSKKTYQHYRCGASIGQNIDCCTAPAFRVGEVDTDIWQWVKKTMVSEEFVRDMLLEAQAEKDEQAYPLRQRLEVIDELLTENRQKLSRLLDLYLSGDFPREMMTERKQRLEQTIAGLEREHAELLRQIERQTVTSEMIESVLKYQARLSQSLDHAEDNFELRRATIEALDMQVKLVVENGQGIAYISCFFVNDSIFVNSTSVTHHPHTGRWAGRSGRR